MKVEIDGKVYIPFAEAKAMRPPNGKHPSDICPECGSESYRTTDTRNRGGYRRRCKECTVCGARWHTIEYMYITKGRPRKRKSAEDF